MLKLKWINVISKGQVTVALSLEALPLQYRRFSEALISLADLVFQERLFPSSHPSCARALSKAFLYIDTMLEERESVAIKLIHGSFYHLNFELKLDEYDNKGLVFLYNILSAASIEELQFDKGLTKDELESFAVFMASPVAGSKDGYGSLQQIRHIRIRGGKGKDKEMDRARKRSQDTDDENKFAREERVGKIEDDDKQVSRGKTVGGDPIGCEISNVLQNLDKLKKSKGKINARRIMRVIDRERQKTSVILLLNSLRNYDEYTFIHSVNVAVISASLARALNFDPEDVDKILIAGLLHDIGKLYVPKTILHKNGKLNPMEWYKMRKHPVYGANILRDEGLEKLLVRVAFEHHMKFDKSGYPSAREDYTATKESDVVRIADTYDAITTKRPYRKQLSPYAAIRFMMNFSGTEFNPEYFDTFVRMMGNIPPGTIVKLNTGETAVVVDINSSDESSLPKVRLIRDRFGETMNDEVVINLNDESSNHASRRIVSVIDDTTIDIEIGMYVD